MYSYKIISHIFQFFNIICCFSTKTTINTEKFFTFLRRKHFIAINMPLRYAKGTLIGVPLVVCFTFIYYSQYIFEELQVINFIRKILFKTFLFYYFPLVKSLRKPNDFLTTISTFFPRTPTMISSASFATIERSTSAYASSSFSSTAVL